MSKKEKKQEEETPNPEDTVKEILDKKEDSEKPEKKEKDQEEETEDGTEDSKEEPESKEDKEKEEDAEEEPEYIPDALLERAYDVGLRDSLIEKFESIEELEEYVKEEETYSRPKTKETKEEPEEGSKKSKEDKDSKDEEDPFAGIWKELEKAEVDEDVLNPLKQGFEILQKQLKASDAELRKIQQSQEQAAIEEAYLEAEQSVREDLGDDFSDEAAKAVFETAADLIMVAQNKGRELSWDDALNKAKKVELDISPEKKKETKRVQLKGKTKKSRPKLNKPSKNKRKAPAAKTKSEEELNEDDRVALVADYLSVNGINPFD